MSKCVSATTTSQPSSSRVFSLPLFVLIYTLHVLWSSTDCELLHQQIKLSAFILKNVLFLLDLNLVNSYHFVYINWLS